MLRRRTIITCWTLLFTVMHSLLAIDQSPVLPLKAIEDFAGRFEKAYASGDKDALAGMLCPSQQEWCFREIDSRGTGLSNIVFLVKVDTASVAKIESQTTVWVDVSYQHGGTARSLNKQRIQFVLEEINGQLVLVDTKDPETKAKNEIMRKAFDLGREFQEAINNNQESAMKRLLGGAADNSLRTDLPWVVTSFTNDSVRVLFTGVDRKDDKVCLRFVAKEKNKKEESYYLYLSQYEGVNAPEYFLTGERDADSKKGLK